MKKKLVRFTTDYRLIIGYIIAFILLLISYLITLYSNKELRKQNQAVTYTHKVISDLETLLSSVKDGETGFRGFLNSRDSVFLAPFYKSLLNRATMLTTIKLETKDDKVVQEKIEKLSSLIDNKYELMMASIKYYNSNNYIIDTVVLKQGNDGRTVMDSIRAGVNALQEHEKTLLDGRSKKAEGNYTALNAIVVASLILAFVFAAFGVITFVKENNARQQADKKVTLYQQELKQRIVELDNANKELIEMRREEKFASTGRIARIIAHEVRNPLTNIDLALSQIKEEVIKDNEDINFLFDVVSRNSTRINELITDLLNATRFTDLSFSNTSVNDVVEEALTLAKDRIELNKIELNKKLDVNIPNVSIDIQKVKIAFLNIIINAIEAMKDINDPVLTIQTKLEGNKCITEIGDNGVGMDELALSKLFEAYYTTKSKGNGLGLTNTQNIILNHKGNINVESKPGKGTKFIITFDIVQ